jgi:hypothetical protein
MNPTCHDDPLTQALGALPPVVPSEARSDRLRALYRDRLERPPRHTPIVLESAVVTVCAIYAWQILAIVIRSSGGGLLN